jgi:zinc-binding in reverse transcriptase
MRPTQRSIPWKLNIPSKIRYFVWLLLRDRILTNKNLQVRNWPHWSSCVLCGATTIEDSNHLFLTCPYAHCIWGNLLPRSHSLPPQIEQLAQTLARALQENHTLAKGISNALWNIWKERNNHIRRQPAQLLQLILTQVQLWEGRQPNEPVNIRPANT